MALLLASASGSCGAKGLLSSKTARVCTFAAISSGRSFQYYGDASTSTVTERGIERGSGSTAREQREDLVEVDIPDPEVPPPPPSNETAIQKAGAIVNFQIQFSVLFGQHLAIVGSAGPMGHWDPQRRIPLQWSEGDVWTVAAPLGHDDRILEYKYVICDEHGQLLAWQPGDNVKLALPEGAKELEVTNVWPADMRDERSSARVTKWKDHKDQQRSPQTQIHVAHLKKALKTHHKTMWKSPDPTSLDAILADRKLASTWDEVLHKLRREDALTLALSNGDTKPTAASNLNSMGRNKKQTASTSSSGATISLSVPYNCNFGEYLGVVGSGAVLGEWNLQHHLPMTWSEGDVWHVDLTVDPTTPHIEYKYVVFDRNGEAIRWQPGRNRQVRVPASLAADPNFTMELCEQFELAQLASISQRNLL